MLMMHVPAPQSVVAVHAAPAGHAPASTAGSPKYWRPTPRPAAEGCVRKPLIARVTDDPNPSLAAAEVRVFQALEAELADVERQRLVVVAHRDRELRDVLPHARGLYADARTAAGAAAADSSLPSASADAASSTSEIHTRSARRRCTSCSHTGARSARFRRPAPS